MIGKLASLSRSTYSTKSLVRWHPVCLIAYGVLGGNKTTLVNGEGDLQRALERANDAASA